LNWLDVVLLLILGLSVIGGIRRGFAQQVIGLIAAVVGLLSALWFYGAAGSFLLPYVSYKGVANFLGFLGVFLGVVLVGTLVGAVVKKVLKAAGLGWLDRVLGGAFGVLRGLLISIVLVLALMAFTQKPPPSSVVNSRVAPYVIDAANICAHLAPREVRDAVSQSYQKVVEAWSEALRKAGKSAGDGPI
jgi:membrane protein required for colicin V production